MHQATVEAWTAVSIHYKQAKNKKHRCVIWHINWPLAFISTDVFVRHCLKQMMCGTNKRLHVFPQLFTGVLQWCTRHFVRQHPCPQSVTSCTSAYCILGNRCWNIFLLFILLDICRSVNMASFRLVNAGHYNLKCFGVNIWCQNITSATLGLLLHGVKSF